MDFLKRLSPAQRQMLTLAVPVVAVFALISTLARRGQPAAAEPSPAPVTGSTAAFTMPSTDAIGVGQLSEFESLLTGRVNALGIQVEETGLLITSALTPPPAPPVPAAPPPPAPAETYPAPPPPAPQPAPCPAFPDELRARMNPGEQLIGQLPAPDGGCWYFSDYGGVFALGGAPFYGSARPYNVGPPTDRRIGRYNPLGRGYQLWSTWGEHYDFPG